jgi:signal transduction histidine kinase
VDPADPKNGSGLGLAIAKEIIGLHNGAIWVESAAGSGSRFYFRLPVECFYDLRQEHAGVSA